MAEQARVPPAEARERPEQPHARPAPPDARQQGAYARLERATEGLQAPFALVDLDAMWANAQDLEGRAAPKPIRLASKSVRCRALQERVLARPGFAGTLTYTLGEALWLASHGIDDLLVAYPTTDTDALRSLGQLSAKRVTVMVDSIEQLDLIERAIGSGAEAIRVCIDLDAGWRALAGRVTVGAKRSPVHTPQQAAELARAIVARERLGLVAIMAYEAQIAGLGDAPPRRPLRARAIRAIQALSARELVGRRAAAVAAVQRVLADAGQPALELVNGGGTGSLHGTAAEPAVSEVTAGSGLYGPTLFDTYRAFQPRPAAMFALPVVRRPGSGVVTALGGGYLASGAADATRLPQPYLPSGLRLDRQEGAGEVQTPLLGDAAGQIAIGDRVYMRHTKAGELCEHFTSLHLLEGDRIVDQAPTYRGEGQCFL